MTRREFVERAFWAGASVCLGAGAQACLRGGEPEGRGEAPESGAELRRYHEETKHSAVSVRNSGPLLDWSNQPIPFKIYETELPVEALALDPAPSGVSALRAVAAAPAVRSEGASLDRRALARILYFSMGIVRRRVRADGRTHYFRAAACTGALYHIDAYVACADLPDLPAGVYHFGPHDFSLRRLRGGDFRGVLTGASGGEPSMKEASAVVVLASTYWRNAWKYQSRAYRHVFWDSGAILAQLLAQAGAEGLRAKLVTGFVDRTAEQLCGLDPEREGVAALVAIGSGDPAPSPRAMDTISYATKALSREEVDYPLIREAHAASSLHGPKEVATWRARAPSPAGIAPRGRLVELLPPSTDDGDPLEKVILRRGSTRVFRRSPISARALSTILHSAAAPLDADHHSDPSAALVELFVIVHAVEGVEPGSYRWLPQSGLERIAAGNWRERAGFLDLGQRLAADAAVNVYAIADLDRVFGRLGNRGYRAAALDGAIGGGKIYLAAYALGLGATGLTFFDDDVARFFNLDPKRYGVMFLTVAGVPARSRKGGA